MSPTKKTKGPDVSSSMDFNELKELIKGSKIIYESKEGKKGPIKEEAKTIAFAFASVAAVKNIKKDEKLTSENIFPIRPSTGFYKVKDYKNLIGLRANRNIEKGSQLKPADVKKIKVAVITERRADYSRFKPILDFLKKDKKFNINLL